MVQGAIISTKDSQVVQARAENSGDLESKSFTLTHTLKVKSASAKHLKEKYFLPFVHTFSPCACVQLCRAMSSDPPSNKVSRSDKLIRLQLRETPGLLTYTHKEAMYMKENLDTCRHTGTASVSN